MTFPALQQRARSEADELLAHAAKEPEPEVAALYLCAGAAFNAAIIIAKMSRAPESLSPSEFVLQQTLLDEYAERAATMVKDTDALARWPKTPGTTFSWKAGDSALDVALQFSQGIQVATLHARSITVGILGHKPPALGIDDPTPDPKIVAWRDAAVKEIQEHTLPQLPAWPMWEIHRDVNCLASVLRDEYGRVVKGAIAPARPAAVPVLDEIDAAILTALSEKQHAMKLYDIAAAAGYSEKTCGEHLVRLIELGYAVRKSERSGVAITDAGRARLKQS